MNIAQIRIREFEAYMTEVKGMPGVMMESKYKVRNYFSYFYLFILF
jgi:hypothetical protein